MRALKRLKGMRIVSTEAALDQMMDQPWPKDALVLRFAPDELYVSPPVKNGEALFTALDPHAIVMREGAFSGVWIETEEALDLLARKCEWEIPASSTWPRLCQGAVAGIPTKLYLKGDHVLFMVPSPYAHEMEERLV